ncbi:AcrR family transcriptional regulator [Lipingzhangella halophila]|uniref:AcrR family transcriptional regulator n=1 Tax=Lipingzhangella halophila TaxID=1783352 RepID=A0A7W7RJY9_9ACTN|nr:TetR/AcrR family transcriptional regulator [Lipingzhangella halophila]MBB4933320.1 AcrR family transcriptional regulator [Lipingzhangella halophila]
MSQREDLLAGAKRCIAEKGYFQTTARDIAAMSGANLASISYHFGSKETLMNTAVLEAVDEWANAVESAVRAARADTPAQRMQIFLDVFLAAAEQDRDLHVASIQAYAQAQFSEEIREPLAATYLSGRAELAAMILGGAAEDVDAETARKLGSLVHAVSAGLLLQYFLDSDSVPTGTQIREAFAMVAGDG